MKNLLQSKLVTNGNGKRSHHVHLNTQYQILELIKTLKMFKMDLHGHKMTLELHGLQLKIQTVTGTSQRLLTTAHTLIMVTEMSLIIWPVQDTFNLTLSSYQKLLLCKMIHHAHQLVAHHKPMLLQKKLKLFNTQTILLAMMLKTLLEVNNGLQPP